MEFLGRETEQDRARVESWSRWAKSQNFLAIVSLVLGIFSLLELNALVFPGVGGVVTGAIALRQLSNPINERSQGRGLAWAGIVTSLVGIALGVLLYWGWFG